jgi:iron complex outermembrane receptor protein
VKKIYFIIILILKCVDGFCQFDTSSYSICLPEAKIVERSLISPLATYYNQRGDSLIERKITTATLGDQLNKEAALFIKSYGPSNISTISLRGSSAAQTAFFWNGMTINNSMHGLTDLSLIPAFLVDNTTVQFGGNGSAQGSGALGGTVYLESKTNFKEGVGATLMASGASFGNYQSGVAVDLSDDKIHVNLKLYTQGGENDFSFKKPEGQKVIQTNAAFKKSGASLDFSTNWKSNKLSLHGWYLECNRQIPPIILSIQSKQEQFDAAGRVVAEFIHDGDKFNYVFHSGWNNEHLIFKDGIANINDTSKANTFQNDAELSYKLLQHFLLTAQGTWIHSKASATGYPLGQELDQLNFSFSAKYEKERLIVNSGVRYGLYNSTVLPFNFSLSTRYKLSTAFSVNANFATVYRVPTLNDLYWSPGGNSKLLPEDGYASSIGVSFVKQISRLHLTAQTNFYYNILNDAIVWTPGDAGYYVDNINKINSKGLEVILEGQIKNANSLFTIRGMPQVTISRITESTTQFTSAIDKQQIYTPEFIFKGFISYEFKNWFVRYDANYTSTTYTTADNNLYLNPYSTGDLQLAYNLKLKKLKYTFTGSINNCWDESYQVIAWRAMPGRNYEAGIIVELVK